MPDTRVASPPDGSSPSTSMVPSRIGSPVLNHQLFKGFKMFRTGVWLVADGGFAISSRRDLWSVKPSLVAKDSCGAFAQSGGR
jgi:hypothetical protein